MDVAGDGSASPEAVSEIFEVDPDLAGRVLESSPDGLLLVDTQGRIVYANRRISALSGHEPESLLGRSVEMLVTGSSRTEYGAEWAEYQFTPSIRAMGGGSALDLCRADGSLLPVEVVLAPVSIGPATMTVASVRDATEFRESDRARQSLLRMLDLEPDAVFVIDALTGQIEYANSGAAKLLGYQADELCQKTVYEITPSASDEARREVLGIHLQAEPGYRHTLTVVRRAKDGRHIICDSLSQIIETDHGQTKFIVVDRDAAERLRREASERRVNETHRLMASLTTAILEDVDRGAIYQQVVEGAARLLGAENALLVLRATAHARFVTVAAHGPVGGHYFDHPEVGNPEVLAAWSRLGECFTLPQPSPEATDFVRAHSGPLIVAPIATPLANDGLLIVFRSPEGAVFTETDVELVADLAGRIATVIELGHARTTAQRVALLEERQRIARDLHDTVIQDLVGIGLQICHRPDGADLEPGERRVLDQLEGVVRRLRTVVFENQGEPAHEALSEAIPLVVAEAERSLGHRPYVTLSGEIDDLPSEVRDQLLPALREALSNVARHAQASTTVVRVSVSSAGVQLVVEDDGVGPNPDGTYGTGLRSMRERALLLGGDMLLERRRGGGSRLSWSVDLGPGFFS